MTRSPEDEDLLDELVEEYLAAAEAGVMLDGFCARHPEHAAGVRRRIERLRGFGLGGEPAAGPRLALGQVLGRGGMGVVYAARDLRLGRDVAVKMLGPVARDGRATERFEREARAIAQLDHPGIVKVFGFDHIDGEPALVMERVDGCSLADLCAGLRATASSPAQLDVALLQRVWRAITGRTDDLTTGARTWTEFALRTVLAVAHALEHAHQRGVLHRDVKPSNVMLCRDGRVQLLDFGLARLADATAITRASRFVGTAAYAAPEQLLRGEVDARSDVYSAGAMLYELLTLRLPFDGETTEQILRQVATSEPPPPRRWNAQLTRDIEAVCLRALEKEPRRRYPGARDFAADLGALLELRVPRARPIGSLRRAGRRIARHPVRTGIVAVVMASAGWIGWRLAESAARTRDLLRDRTIRVSEVGQALGRLHALCAERGHDAELVGARLADCVGDIERLRTGDPEQDSELDRMRAEAREIERDRRFVLRFEAAMNASGFGSPALRARNMVERLIARLRDHGLELLGLDADLDLVAERIERSAIRDELLAALNQLRVNFSKRGDRAGFARMCGLLGGRYAADDVRRELFGRDVLPGEYPSLLARVDFDRLEPFEMASLALPLAEAFGVDHAVSVLDRAVRRAPGRFELWLARARVVQASGAPSADQFRAAVAANPERVAAWLGLAKAIRAESGAGDALPWFLTTCDRFPDSAVAWLLLGACHHDLGEYEPARAAYRRALELDPGCAEAKLSLTGLTAAPNDRLDLVLQAFDTDPDLVEAQNAVVDDFLAYGRERLGEAEIRLRRQVEKAFRQPYAHAAHARVLAALGRSADAARHFRSAYMLGHERAASLRECGLALVACGRDREAVGALWHALILDPSDAAARAAWTAARERRGQRSAPDVLALVAGDGELVDGDEWLARARIRSRAGDSDSWERALRELGAEANYADRIDAALALLDAADAAGESAPSLRVRAWAIVREDIDALDARLSADPAARAEVLAAVEAWRNRPESIGRLVPVWHKHKRGVELTDEERQIVGLVVDLNALRDRAR